MISKIFVAILAFDVALAGTNTGVAPVSFNGKALLAKTGAKSNAVTLYTSTAVNADVSAQFLYDKVKGINAPISLATTYLANDATAMKFSLQVGFDTVSQNCV
jgi:hypothetical protein